MEEPSQDDERFDASQYAFFGGDISQEVELGGLDEEDEITLGAGAFDEERSLLPSVAKEEDDVLDAISQLDGPLEVAEMSSSFMNLGRYPSDLEVSHDTTRQAPNFLLQRQWEGQETGLTQVPFPVARAPVPIPLQAAMFHNGRQQGPASQGNLFPGYRPHVPLPFRGPLQPFSRHVGSHAMFPPPPFWHGMPPSHVQQGMAGVPPRFPRQYLAQQYASLPLLPEALLPRQFGHFRIPFANVHQPLFNPMLSVQPDDYFYEDGDFWHDLEQQHRQTARAHPHSPHRSASRDSTHQHYRSKYMTFEEIEGIAKIQRAATQNQDPYVGDYYRQAVQAKNGTGPSKGRHHFAPRQLRDLSSHRRSSVVQPSFVPVEGLGKVPFSSVRGPRPLLEVDNFSAQSGGANNSKLSERPLEQEPMLAARIAIEDGSCLVLDVDDIDRYLSSSHLSDGGAQLRRQRQTLLEDLAVSLQFLSDEEGNGSASLMDKNGHQVDSEPKDVVFLHIVSLPKGRKLVCRFLELLSEGNELVRRACVIIFRHLHFLFGAPQRDPDAAVSTLKLAKMVASCASQMDLNATSVCVAAVVSSSEKPFFKPLSSPDGEGTSLILKSSLDRATRLLTDSVYVCVAEDKSFWQATFDIFFHVLLEYCANTFNGILHTKAMSPSAGESVNVGESAAETMSKEMPIELLRASLPHMNDQQRKMLLDFTQRSIVMEPSTGHQTVRGDHSGHGNLTNVVLD